MTDLTCTCGQPTSGAWLCDDCQTTLRWALVNVAAYYTDLGTVAQRQAHYGSAGTTKGSIGKSQPLPVDLRFVDQTIREGHEPAHHGAQMAPGSQLKWDAWNTVVAWCRTVMEDQPELLGPACIDCLHISCSATRRRRWPSSTLTSMIRYLSRQFAYVVRSEWVTPFLDEMLDLERRLKRMIDRPADRWYAGKCSATDLSGNECTSELYAAEDRGDIMCPACDTRHDVASRRDFLLAEARAFHVTATEAAGALIAWTDYDGSETKLVDRIRKWRDRDRLDVQDVTSLHGRDRHLYRLGDIQDLLIEHAQREQTRRVTV